MAKEATISVNGGPEVPMSVAKAALDVVLSERSKRVAAGGLHTEGLDDRPKNIAGERLRSIVERIERLEEERKALGSDVKDIYIEAKSAGFDVKVVRQLIRIRKQEPADVEEQETLLDVYRRAIGM